jgi:phospholipid/cholesterol/gamma-HCH transport system permease protein
MLVRSVALLGRNTRLQLQRSLDRIRFVGAVARAQAHHPRGAWPLAVRVMINQVRFTAVHALPLLGVVAGAIGLSVVVQAYASARLGMAPTLGSVFTTVVLRELGPLLTAVVVIGRSGTAIAAELATTRVLREAEALESMGVDPLQYWVGPRVAAAAVSMMLLIVYFDAVALLGGALIATAMGLTTLPEFAESLRLAVRPADVWLTLGKGAVFGAGIALLCSHEGLTGGDRPTDIPQAVTRAVVSSLLFVFLASALFTWVMFTR